MSGEEGFGAGSARDPLRLFEAWYGEAVRSGAALPEAMTLATASRDGRPSARMVLFKGIAAGGIDFFTNLESRKSRELSENPRAALVFHWGTLGRQVRIEGAVERVPAREAETYFRTRPRGSQISAWASPQSEPVASRRELEERVAQAARRFEGKDVPCPPFWGGFRVKAESFEFWIHRDNRLHDRFLYRRTGTGWEIARLAP
ncbi:MAG TPA: pyridoxamine 5'-phosphate oxidase [Planctomycetota bacterium]|jgi:pyridoxamine 5'-phosphate oxidase|nr:pyridoxamine 5'-phosphate oxidase [Planctomycetota bacterium]